MAPKKDMDKLMDARRRSGVLERYIGQETPRGASTTARDLVVWTRAGHTPTHQGQPRSRNIERCSADILLLEARQDLLHASCHRLENEI
jgi:hypothetical protein